MVHTIKPTNLCIKQNPKNLQKQHGCKLRYILKNHQKYIKYTKVLKPSMSYKFKTNINHNHSVSKPINNYPKHKQNNLK